MYRFGSAGVWYKKEQAAKFRFKNLASKRREGECAFIKTAIRMVNSL